MDQLVNTALFLEGKLIYKKLKDRYRIYCMKCRRYEYVSKDMLKQIQVSHICPMCFQEIKLSKKLEHQMLNYIMDDNFDGWRVVTRFKFGCKVRYKAEHVCRYLSSSQVEVRLITCSMGYSFGYRPDLKEWKPRRAQIYMYRFDTISEGKPIESKKEYIYKALFDRGMTNQEADEKVKSNQKKLFMDYLLNGKQMEYVIAFDLKSYEDVYKYRAYINDKRNNAYPEKAILNVYYLDYLSRNDIRTADFYDYKRDCDALGFKLDKPTDFRHRHLTVAQIASEKRRKKTEEGAKKRYETLKKREYRKGRVEIKAFKDADEIRKCGKTLHNCIGTYVRSYAEKETDLFYLTVDGKMTVAIECRKRKLKQARTDKNGDCPPELMRHINRWLEAT